jgi:hypothetical protein
VAEAASVEVALVEAELEDLRQLITLVVKVETEQAQVVVEIITNQESVLREVTA